MKEYKQSHFRREYKVWDAILCDQNFKETIHRVHRAQTIFERLKDATKLGLERKRFK